MESNYKRTVLFESEVFEVVSMEWAKSDLSEMHNHGWSQCMILIQEGVFENTLDLGNKLEVQILEVGQTINSPVGAKHEMRCLSATGKSLHIYTPKINELTDAGQFKIPSLDAIKNDLQLDAPTDITALRQIMAAVSNHSVTTHSPYFMNQLFSGVAPQMLLAEELISQTKTTLATIEASPALSQIESEVIESLGEIIGWSKGQRDGVSVPGGSAANFMAVHCARQKLFPGLKKTGMSGQQFRIFVSSEAHYSLKKACAVLGLGTDSLVIVPSQASGQMDPQSLSDLIKQHRAQGATPLMVTATAGTTVLGAFDAIDKISDVCQQNGIWLHVDAAWGGPALFSKNLRPLVRGIELADSVTFDAHKLFGANLTCSFFLTKHYDLLLQANDVSGGDYLFHSEDAVIDRGKFSWQCGRKADAVSFWTIWKSLGTAGLGQFVDRLIAIRDETLAWAKNKDRLELVSPPDFLNLCFRVLPPNDRESKSEWSKKVREVLKEKNLVMVNYSTDQNGTFLRLILAHPYLKTEHVQNILQWALDVQ